MPRERSSIKVLITDDHAVFRDGLRKLLEGADDISVVAEASNGNQCIKMLGKFKPDILLLDLRMPDKGGLRPQGSELRFVAHPRDRAHGSRR
jgi:DNA-binding NarL/FixJ family response regulator